MKLALFALLVSLPMTTEAQQIVGPLQTQNNLSEIMRNGSGAQAAARSNIGAGVPSVNQPKIPPLVNTVGTSSTTVFAARAFLSIYIPVLTPNATMTCSGDGGATSGTASYPQYLQWPAVPNGAVPPGPIICTASIPTSITQAGTITAQAY